MSVCPAKTQISLGIRPVWSESSLCAQWVAKDPRLLHADSEDSDQTGRMPRLIWVFAGCTTTLLVLSCCGSCGSNTEMSHLLTVCHRPQEQFIQHRRILASLYIMIWHDIVLRKHLTCISQVSVNMDSFRCFFYKPQQKHRLGTVSY